MFNFRSFATKTFAAALALGSLAGAGSLAYATPASAATVGPYGAFVALDAPTRAIDTRLIGQGAPVTGEIAVTLPGAPTGVVAAAVNVTAVGHAGEGYVVAWAADQSKPEGSLLNPAAGIVVNNNTIVRTDAQGRIKLFTLTPADLIVDVSGFWVDSRQAPAGEGRVKRLPNPTPQRVLDTRESDGRLGPCNAASCDTRTIDLSGLVPADATGVAVSFTVADAPAGSFITAWDAAKPRPLASVTNAATNPKSSGVAFVPLSAGRRLSFIASGGGHVMVDLAGSYIGRVATSSSTEGLLLPWEPIRLMDDRESGPNMRNKFAVPPAAGAAIALLNVTVVEGGVGYATAYGQGFGQPLVSQVSVPVANATTAATALVYAPSGAVVYSQAGGWIIVDEVASFAIPTGVPAFTHPRTTPTPFDRQAGRIVAPTAGIDVVTATLNRGDLDGQELVDSGRAFVIPMMAGRRAPLTWIGAHRQNNMFIGLGNLKPGDPVVHTNAVTGKVQTANVMRTVVVPKADEQTTIRTLGATLGATLALTACSGPDGVVDSSNSHIIIVFAG